MAGAKFISLSSCLVALASAEEEEAKSGIKGVKVSQHMPGGDCSDKSMGDVTYYEGCWTWEEDDDIISREYIIDGDEWTVKHFDGPSCQEDDEKEDDEETGEIDECTAGGQMYEEVKLKGDYYHYESYGEKGEGCEEDDLEGRTMFSTKDMRDGKCDPKFEDVWKITTVSDDGMTITEERFEDKKCKDAHPDYPTLVIPATGACTKIEDLDEDEDEVITYVKLYYTNEDGKSSSGHTLQLSHGVVAVTSFASLVATMI